MASYKKRSEIQSFRDACTGIGKALCRERHMRFHLAAAIVVLLLSFFYRLSPVEWLAVIAAIVFVVMAELFNSAFEALVDLACPERHPLAGYAKDVAAGAVLVAAVGAFVVGLIIFLPKIFS